jgi:DNA-binding FrmR family transcriptional regulator
MEPGSWRARSRHRAHTDEDRYCIDIVTQVRRSVRRSGAWRGPRDHVAHCVEHAIASGNKADQRRKIEELMDVVGRADR